MITLNHVSYSYGRVPVLRDVCCDFPDARVTALIGANGAGKSTCLKLCAGLLNDASDISVDSLPLKTLSPKERARHVSYMPQSRPVPMLTVRSLVSQGRYPYSKQSDDAEFIRRALAAVGMEDLSERGLDTLSGGQRQKAYLAMLLAQDTQNILLDEPTASLDIRARLECLALLRELRGRGRCVVIAMHDIPQAIESCDRVMLLRGGRVLWQGGARDIPLSALREAFAAEPSYQSRLTFSLFR